MAAGACCGPGGCPGSPGCLLAGGSCSLTARATRDGAPTKAIYRGRILFSSRIRRSRSSMRDSMSLALRVGRLTRLLEAGADREIWELEGEDLPAVAFPALVGRLEPGVRVWLNA